MITGAQHLKPERIEGVILDLWCTLFNPGLQEEAVVTWAQQLKLDHPAIERAIKDIEHESGYGRPALIDDWMSGIIAAAGHDKISATQARRYAHRLGILTAAKGEVYPGAHRLLRQLRQNYRVGILSTVSHRGRLAAKSLGLDVPWVDAAIFSCEVHAMKPEPEAYRIAGRELGVELGRCLFVDDHVEYAAAALTHGIISVVVLHPQGHTAALIRRGELTRADLTSAGLIAIDRISELGTLLELPDWQEPAISDAERDTFEAAGRA